MKSQFTAEQISKIVQESYAYEGALKDVARKYGVSTKTIGNWKRRFNGMKSGDIKRLKDLEAENARLKRVVANLTLDVECLKEINSKKW